MNTSQIFKKVLAEVTPSSAERGSVNRIINFVKTSLQKELDKGKITAEVIVGGSTAKDTWLTGNYDIDFFVRFDKRHENVFSQILKKAVSKIFKKIKVLQGSREYYQVNYKGYGLEFVPVLAVASPSEAKNSIDASPFHIHYVKNHIKRNPDLANQIRLLKSFAYSSNAYGAETYLSGLSGYAIELLMIYYKSFDNMVNALEKARPKIFIDIENHYKNSQEIENVLGSAKLSSPIILVDPVLKSRNAAAALNYNTFARLLLAVRLFKRNPAISCFRYQPPKITDLIKASKKRGTIFVYERLKKPAEKEDIYFAKLNHKLEVLNSKFKKAGLGVYNLGYFESPLIVYFEFETLKLSNYTKHIGPPVWLPERYFDEFVKKWKNVYVSGTNIAVDLKRDYTNIAKFATKVLKGELKNV